jgi:hypothetical protein
MRGRRERVVRLEREAMTRATTASSGSGISGLTSETT